MAEALTCNVPTKRQTKRSRRGGVEVPLDLEEQQGGMAASAVE